MPTQEELTNVQTKYVNMLMKKPNVVGVAVGHIRENGILLDEKGIIVMVTEKVPENQLPPKDRIPRELDGVRVDVQAFGTLTAH